MAEQLNWTDGQTFSQPNEHLKQLEEMWVAAALTDNSCRPGWLNLICQQLE